MIPSPKSIPKKEEKGSCDPKMAKRMYGGKDLQENQEKIDRYTKSPSRNNRKTKISKNQVCYQNSVSSKTVY